MAEKWYVLPPTTIVDEAIGEDVQIPKYTDRDDVGGYSGSLVPAPQSWPGETTTDGKVYVARVEAADDAHAAASGAGDVWAIGDGDQADVSFSQAQQYLNQTFRPQSWEELKAQLPEARDLEWGEWARRLGGN